MAPSPRLRCHCEEYTELAQAEVMELPVSMADFQTHIISVCQIVSINPVVYK